MTLPNTTVSLISSLQDHGIDPILYGSQGVSLYIGQFKEFGDVDLLVPDEWVQKRWQELISVMGALGYSMVNEHEHEFEDEEKSTVGFAGESILIRDGISIPESQDIIWTTVSGASVRTLSAKAFRRVYRFSVHDGYRIETRGKKDAEIISLLDSYLKT